jgi:hydroxymethylpyrimidine/phosphomethylpyrimidine kinase
MRILAMQSEPLKTVLTIAGSDPTGGAGIQADLKTLHALGVHGISVIAALTAQDVSGVRGVFPVEPKAFSLQLETLLKDSRPHAVKTGMLLTAENIRITARLLKHYPSGHLVIDPVIRSSNGVPLLEEQGVDIMINELFPLASVVTPNLSEACRISGMKQARDVKEEEWVREMCKAIHSMGPRHVIITGGHRTGAPEDLLYDGLRFESFTSSRVPIDLHGSGCIFSSALCGYLALGHPITEAVQKAKDYMIKIFRK